jgi:DNA-binding winged helix-turn-helix (wHTH) protein
MFIISSSRIAFQIVMPLGIFVPAAITAPSDTGNGYYEHDRPRKSQGFDKDSTGARTMRVGFASFVLDSGSRELLKDGSPVHLSPKAFDILEILVARRPNVVNKALLLEEVWPGKVVEEANLAIVVGEIRKALGDDPKAPSIVVTVSRRGYRFAADAGDLDRQHKSDPGRESYVRWWLTWHDKTLPLHEGENLVGRHPASAVWINGSSVSRTHARILVTPTGVSIEDRGSRNGTFVDGDRIGEPHLLVDGSRLTFGSEETTFRQWLDDPAVGTEPVRRTKKKM